MGYIDSDATFQPCNDTVIFFPYASCQIIHAYSLVLGTVFTLCSMNLCLSCASFIICLQDALDLISGYYNVSQGSSSPFHNSGFESASVIN